MVDETNSPVEGAKVICIPGFRIAYTNKDGRFSLSGIPTLVPISFNVGQPPPNPPNRQTVVQIRAMFIHRPAGIVSTGFVDATPSSSTLDVGTIHVSSTASNQLTEIANEDVDRATPFSFRVMAYALVSKV